MNHQQTIDIETALYVGDQWALATEAWPVNHVVNKSLLRGLHFGRTHGMVAQAADKLGISVDTYESIQDHVRQRPVEHALLGMGAKVTPIPVANLEPQDLRFADDWPKATEADLACAAAFPDVTGGREPKPVPTNRAAQRAAARTR